MTDPWTLQAGTFSAAARLAGWDRAATAASSFRRNGYTHLGPLPRESALALGDRIRKIAGEADGPLVHADTAALLGIGEVRAIATSGDVWREAGMWLGAEPRIIDVGAWVSTPATDGTGLALSQGWHHDLDDWRACKQFVYLSDVTDDTGPQEFVPGSHREGFYEDRGLAPEKFFYGSGRNADAGVIDGFPRVVFVGVAGRRWLGNTFCWHRGRPLRGGTRVMLQVCYGLTCYAHMREKMDMIREGWGL